MEIGILGLPQSGKSTLFEIMTGLRSREIHGEASVRGVAIVPDARFSNLARIFTPKKITPAKVPFVDICPQGENPWEAIRKTLSAADGLVHVVDGFTSSDAKEVAARYAKLADELILSDLVVVEGRLERLAKIPRAALKADEAIQAELFPRLREALGDGTPLRSLSLAPADAHALRGGLPTAGIECRHPGAWASALRGFGLWTLRPELVVVNAREDTLSLAGALSGELQLSSPAIGICCQMEAEIAELPPGERAGFLETMGVAEPAFERIIRTAFALLGRICYFTVGEDEVRAWVIPANSPAPRAAAAIHKDFERGFIKAEVVSYDDFVAAGESLAGAKAAGRLRLEGKEYIMQDGDIISFRFNV